jgi:hypothetical protein
MFFLLIPFSEGDFHWTFFNLIIDIFHRSILGQVNITAQKIFGKT